jgi:transposase InsO family protein
MPWECKTVEEVREKFVLQALQTNNFSKLCREFNITRKTGYKWLDRYNQGRGLSNQSRKPHCVSNKTPDEIEKIILSTRADNPGWGSKKIRIFLENQGVENLPCAKTINNILNRFGCISQEESLKHQPLKIFEKQHCNDMWQTDFKGEFLTNDGLYCYPLTIVDDHSRFSIKIACYTNTKNVVIPSFKAAFQEFGMPRSVLSDNGVQFAGFKHGYTQFEKFLMDNDILPIHCRLKHPQTQGKIERFHGSMKRELLNHMEFNNIDEANKSLQEWRTKYNCSRPHEALNNKCPADIYTPSERIYVDKVKDFEYDGSHRVIKVNSWGYMRFDKFQVYLSETMIGEYVEFRPNPNNNSFFICYRNFIIAEYSAIDGTRINRHIRRL